MREEIAKKWIAELRSGNHNQAIGTMQNAEGAMCCLGVLRHHVLETHEHKRASNHNLTQTEVRLAEMNSPNGSFREGSSTHQLTFLNDTMKMSFSQIADVIERDWEKL